MHHNDQGKSFEDKGRGATPMLRYHIASAGGIAFLPLWELSLFTVNLI